jgi:hypothetical protein
MQFELLMSLVSAHPPTMLARHFPFPASMESKHA